MYICTLLYTLSYVVRQGVGGAKTGAFRYITHMYICIYMYIPYIYI